MTTAFRPVSASGGRGGTRDIVVTAIIGVVFGVVFPGVNFVWGRPADAAFAFFPPANPRVQGVWLMPAVLVPLIVRKPGTAIFAEVVAAALSAVIGSQFGPDAILSGVVQGGAAESSSSSPRGHRPWSFPVPPRRRSRRLRPRGSTTGSSGIRRTRSTSRSRWASSWRFPPW
ncbi:MAG: ECF transporter S component [Chloroflexota bacterium]